MLKRGIPSKTIDVYLSDKERIPVRLYLEIVPDEVYQTRIRKKKAENKKKDRALSNNYKAVAHFNLFITNASEEILPSEQMITLYKTRWQIELLFKSWKSTLGINKIHPMKYNRLMCLLYAKLILYLITSQTTRIYQSLFFEINSKHLSIQKCIKTQLQYFERIRGLFTLHRIKTSEFVEEFFRIFAQNHWLESRKNKLCFKEIFDIFTCVLDK